MENTKEEIKKLKRIRREYSQTVSDLLEILDTEVEGGIEKLKLKYDDAINYALSITDWAKK